MRQRDTTVLAISVQEADVGVSPPLLHARKRGQAASPGSASHTSDPNPSQAGAYRARLPGVHPWFDLALTDFYERWKGRLIVAEEIEEERRLLYVAMTRARESLHLMVPQRFYTTQQARRGDRHVYASRTRFIPDAALPTFNERTWPEAELGDAPRASSTVVRRDVKARVRGMWR